MKMLCDKCGTKMIDKTKGPYVHFVCPQCGHAVATYDYSKEDPIKLDKTIYSVRLINNKPTIELIKILSKLSGSNYLECKEKIEQNEIVLAGKAVEIAHFLAEIKLLNIKPEITPDFPYIV